MRGYSPNAGTKWRTDRVVHILRNDHEVRKVFASAYDLVVSLQDPDAALIVQPLPPLHSYPLVVGAKKSRSFGTTILFGLGGEYLQAEKDYAISLPPLNQTLGPADDGGNRDLSSSPGNPFLTQRLRVSRRAVGAFFTTAHRSPPD
jgi:hypothetical protein